VRDDRRIAERVLPGSCQDFNMVTHADTREMPIYNLVFAR